MDYQLVYNITLTSDTYTRFVTKFSLILLFESHIQGLQAKIKLQNLY